MLSSFTCAVRMLRGASLVLALAGIGLAQEQGDADLTQAYKSLSTKDYDDAIASFRSGLLKDPGNASAHKDLAYTYLKTGDNVEARDQFEAAMRLKPADETAALEYSFLAFETKKPIEARRIFDRLRQHGMAATRSTAEQAFQNIDRPLAAGIARWQQALARSAHPDDVTMFSAHWELAQLAEQRDNLPVAAEQYEICRKLKPQMSEILLSLARVWQQLNRVEEAHAALLAASRNHDPRTAENALELLGPRYPYPYEFVNATAIDPQNVALRRELGFLYLAMEKQPEAVQQFEKALAIDPQDSVSRDQLNALQGVKKAELGPTTTGASPSVDARAIGMKSFALGYSRDAIKYLRQAHDDNPDDAEVMLKLGYAYNYSKDDFDAIQWFDRARQSSDPAIASEASKAFHNLRGDATAQTTSWMLPMYSSRWHDVFTYGQLKRTLPLPWSGLNRWFSLYFSARYSGDLKSSIPQAQITPQYLSESSVIFGTGVSSRMWHHISLWAEAGESVNYLPFRHDIGIAIPDYRGGLTFAKGFGHLLGTESSGYFFETTADADYVSRYNKDWIFNSQNRTGRTFVLSQGTTAQVLWNANLLHDLKNQYWAETVETGPGLRLHLPWMRPGVYFSADLLRGAYTNNAGNPRRPNYDDVRVGLWYAFTK